MAGALVDSEYRERLARAGFINIGVEETRVYEFDETMARELLPGLTPEQIQALKGAVVSAFIRAVKP